MSNISNIVMEKACVQKSTTQQCGDSLIANTKQCHEGLSNDFFVMLQSFLTEVSSSDKALSVQDLLSCDNAEKFLTLKKANGIPIQDDQQVSNTSVFIEVALSDSNECGCSMYDAMKKQLQINHNKKKDDWQITEHNNFDSSFFSTSLKFISKPFVIENDHAISDKLCKNNYDIVQYQNAKIDYSRISELNDYKFLETIHINLPSDKVSTSYELSSSQARVKDSGIIDQILVKCKNFVGSNKTTYLQMNPPHLGRVEIVLRSDEQSASISLLAERWDGYHAISQNLDQLKSYLENALPEQKAISLNLDLKEQFGENDNQESNEWKSKNINALSEKNLDDDTAYDSIYSINIVSYSVNILV